MSSIFTLIFCGSAFGVDLNETYSNDSDFDQGTLINLEHDSTSNQLQLVNGSQSAFPYIWVPNSNQGTVSKVSTTNGLELARYRPSPATSASAASPSRTTIDLDGGCWVGNRGTGTVVKIGLLENGGFFDRNHNGMIETSRDLDGNGVIDGVELLDWGTDECVLWEVVVIPGLESAYRPGEYTGSYSGTPGPRGIAVDHDNNVWIGTYGTHRFYYVNGTTGEILRNIDVTSTGHSSYGAVIDQNGILWSSGSSGNNILRLDPSNNTFTRINIGHTSYGIGLDRNNHLFVSGWTDSCFSRINILTGVIEWRKPAPYQSRGVVVTDDGDVWIANSGPGTVTRYSNDGEFKATIIVGNVPTGVSVDNNGKVWVVDNEDEYIHRICPTRNQTDSNGNIINGVELSKRIIGGTHYGYSDMTGSVSSTITTNKGTWTVIHDSGLVNIPWGIISWNGSEPTGTSIKVRVRSSHDQQNWSNWEEAINGRILTTTPVGRYLQVETTLTRFLGSETPILYDLSITALVADVQLNMTVDKPSPRVGENVTFTLKAINQGPMDVTGLNINVSIPPGFTVNNTSHGNYHNEVWNVGNLTKGEVATLTISGLVNPSMAHRTITCLAEKYHQDQYDPTIPDTAKASFYPPLADLDVTSNFNNSTLNVGETAVFTTIIQNNGPDPSRNLIIEIPLPTGFTSLLPSLGIYENGIWAIPILNAGSIAKITLIGEVTQNMAHKTITETIEIIQKEYDPTPNSIINSSFYVPLVDLEITKTARHDPVPVGGVALFTISVKNRGPDTARGVVIRNAVPDNFIPGTPSKGIIQSGWWLIDVLEPGKSATLLIGHLVDDVGKLTNDATITSKQHDPNSINNRYLLTVSTKNRIIIRPPVIYPPAPYDPSSDDPNNNHPPNPNTPTANVTNPGSSVNSVGRNSTKNQTIPMQDTGLGMSLPSLALLLVFFGAYINRKGAPRNKPFFAFLILIAALLSCGVVGAVDGSQNYTNNSDFDEGTLKGVEYKSTRDQLQLPPSSEEPEFIWIPNTNEGTISKVNTQTGAEVARYRTGPNTNVYPFTATLDKEGNCWVANAHIGSLVKIGLYEKGVHQDRNNNGIIDTSRDLDHNGIITGTELLAWGADECVLFETILIPGNEGTYIPGTYTGAYGNYDYGIRSLAIDSHNNLWAGNYNTRIYHYINTDGQILRTVDLAGVNHNPYTSVIDQNGILWSGGNNLLRLDPSTDSITITNLGYFIHSLALDSDVHLFSYGYTSGWNRNSRLSRININNGSLDWTQTLSLSNVAGMAITSDGDVWVSEYRTYWGGRTDLVKRYSHNGELKATMKPGYGPNGLSVDSNGKVWVVDWDDEYIHRIDPAINGVDLSKRIVGGRHYTTSSMTSTSNISGYFQEGTWTVTHDTENINTRWGTINWTSSEPTGTSITVKIRSSNDQQNWSTWEDVVNGVLLHLTPAGRYLQVEVTLTSTIKNISPILYDLTITPLPEDPVEPIEEVDLVASITTDNYTPQINDTVKIILNVGNNGPNNASNVNATYKLPFGMEYLSSNGNYDVQTGLWTVGNLNSGSSATLEILAKILNTGSLVNVGTVTGSEYDPYPANNRAELTLNVPYVDPDNQIPEIPSNLPDNGIATLPPIPNIEDLLDLDIYQPGTNPEPPNNPPNPPGPDTPDPTPPGPNPPNPGPNPNPTDPNLGPSNTPNTQLARDIRGVRAAVSTGNFEENIPEWNLTFDEASNVTEDNSKENEEWKSFLLKFAGEVIFFAIVAAIPNEYLQQVGNAFANTFKVLGDIARYFGYGKQVKQIAQLWERSKVTLQNPAAESYISKWSTLMKYLEPNLGEMLLEKTLIKIFPNSANEIKLLMNIISTAEFREDPFGTIQAIINVGLSILSHDIPNPRDLEEFLTF
jgi:uncharacterized repeat protein (TIGR01451 family)